MTSCTYATFTSPLNLSVPGDISAIATEALVDAVINCINLYNSDAGLPNMTGTAGSKTVNLQSKQLGAVQLVFRVLYASWFKNAENTNVSIQSLSVSTSDLLSNSAVLASVKEAAQLLREFDWSRAII